MRPQLSLDVCLHVGLDVRRLRERLGAQATPVRPCSRVAVDVRLGRVRLVEPGATGWESIP